MSANAGALSVKEGDVEGGQPAKDLMPAGRSMRTSIDIPPVPYPPVLVMCHPSMKKMATRLVEVTKKRLNLQVNKISIS